MGAVSLPAMVVHDLAVGLDLFEHPVAAVHRFAVADDRRPMAFNQHDLDRAIEDIRRALETTTDENRQRRALVHLVAAGRILLR